MASRPRLSFAVPWRAVLGTLIVAQPACATRELERAPATPDKAWTLPEDSDYAQALREASHEGAAVGGGPQENRPRQPNASRRQPSPPTNRSPMPHVRTACGSSPATNTRSPS